MIQQKKRLSRRDFLIRSTLFTAGAYLGSNLPARPLVHALPCGHTGHGDDYSRENPKLSIIIDDVGYNTRRIEPFLRLGIPITFSILPHLRYSRKLAETVQAEGHEVMLHQPMQPYSSSFDPGPGALYLKQQTEEMYRIVEENLASFAHAVGVNNHMGSQFTESEEKMAAVLKLFKNKGLFFVDSVTTSNSVAFNTARKLHMTTAFRNVFIDNQREKSYICSQLVKLRKHALKYGHAIGIGHPRPETVGALEEFLDGLEGSGFSITYASQVVYTRETPAFFAGVYS